MEEVKVNEGEIGIQPQPPHLVHNNNASSSTPFSSSGSFLQMLPPQPPPPLQPQQQQHFNQTHSLGGMSMSPSTQTTYTTLTTKIPNNNMNNMSMNAPAWPPTPQQQQQQQQQSPNYSNHPITSTMVSTPTTTNNSTGELQNELLKQLLQNTAHAGAGMNQVLSETPGFSLLNTCLTTKSSIATNVPLRISHLSEAATRIPQPTPRPFENNSMIQIQPQEQQLQQQPLPQQILQPPPSPMPAPPTPTSTTTPYRHPPQVFDWNNSNSSSSKPQTITSPRVSMDGGGGSSSSTSSNVGPGPSTTPTSTPTTPTTPTTTSIETKINIIKPELEFLSNITTTTPPTRVINENNIIGGVGSGSGSGSGSGTTMDIVQMSVDHKPMLDMSMFSSLPPTTTTPTKKMDDEAKKAKRRQYQAKRRQSQVKEQQLAQQQQQQQQQQSQLQSQQQQPNTTTPPQQQQPTPKKRARKTSKIEENYDNFMENLMIQLRRLPPVGVVEPEIERNYSICECNGQSDLSNIKLKNIGHGGPSLLESGDLEGEFGCSTLTHRLDYYNQVQSPSSNEDTTLTTVRLPQQQIQRGFYNQEFSCPRIILPGDKTTNNRTPTPVRDTDTPDTIVSSSSPECIDGNGLDLYPGLKLIDPDEDSDDVAKYLRDSPDITIINPIPNRPNFIYDGSNAAAPANNNSGNHNNHNHNNNNNNSSSLSSSNNDTDKENKNHNNNNSEIILRPSSSSSLSSSLNHNNNNNTTNTNNHNHHHHHHNNKYGFGNLLRNNGNISVTLTLSSSAADDIGLVLRDLANILSLTSPGAGAAAIAALQQKNNELYTYKSKDGKEFDDIQSILNGATKFCRHCDVIILNNIIKKSASDFPGIISSSSTTTSSTTTTTTTTDNINIINNNNNNIDNINNEFYFCSSTCLIQFSMSQGLGGMIGNNDDSIEDKIAGGVVNHLSEIKNQQQQQQQHKRCGNNNSNIIETGSGKIKNGLELVPYTSNTTTATTTAGTTTTTGGGGGDDDDSNENDNNNIIKKKWKGIRYKNWTPTNNKPEQKYKKPNEKEMTEMLFRLGITVLPKNTIEDTRKCLFCHMIGDGISNGPGRLLNIDVDKWVHLNCALWSKEVYETENGGLINLELAFKQSLILTCLLCKLKGATVKCFKIRCSSVYHLGCAIKEGCIFYKNKTIYCSTHSLKEEKYNELLTLAVQRRVYIQRDENRQVGTVLLHSNNYGTGLDSINYILRVGTLILLNIGQLLPHQLSAFHSRNYIYPIGYKIIRYYWSMKYINKRCQYICSIHEKDGRPEFHIIPQEECNNNNNNNNHHNNSGQQQTTTTTTAQPIPSSSSSTSTSSSSSSKEKEYCIKSNTARGAWLQVIDPVAKLRSTTNGIKIFPKYIIGEDLFGLNEPSIVKVLESLPGVETLIDYHFKYGRNPLLELPLAINPTGCARTEPKLRTHFKRLQHGTQCTATTTTTGRNNNNGRSGGGGSSGTILSSASPSSSSSSSSLLLLSSSSISSCSSSGSSLSSGGGSLGSSSTSTSAQAAALAAAAVSYLSDFGVTTPYSKQFVHSKSSQYKKMKNEWRNNIFLARSKIQGLGLYAARDIEKHTMIIEYIGEIIRKKLADRREHRYEGQNRGIYMFRIDDERVIDATLCGGLARYINHSCSPNCITETVEVDRDLKIIIFANRRISRGEELSYDYKFEFEDAQHKIPCLCGTNNCRKWMN